MAQRQSLNIKQRLQRLGKFSSIFDAKGFQFGKIVTNDPRTGQLLMPYYDFSSEASAFIDTCYQAGWVLEGFDWTTWINTPEAIKLRDNPDAMASATPDQIAKLLTALVRQERFSDGTLASAFKSGLLLAISRRAMTLAHDE